MDLRDTLLRLAALTAVRRYTATTCGHRTKRVGEVSAFGHSTTMRMPKNKAGSVDYCLDCIGKMTIQCAWCDEPIFIGNPITLYIPRDDFKVPEHAVVFEEKPPQLVGCLGWECAISGADRAGFWMPGEDGKGKVFRVPTVYEQLVFGAGEPSAMVVNDVGDIREALNPRFVPLKDQAAK